MEGGAEVGTVDGGVPRGFRIVDVFALGAVHLDGLLVGDIGLAHREERMRVADDAGAFAEVGFFVFVKLKIRKITSRLTVALFFGGGGRGCFL